MATVIAKCDNVKTRQCKERRRVLRTEPNPENSSKIVFSEEVLSLANNSSLLRIDHSDDSGKIILVCAGEDCKYLRIQRLDFFLWCPIKNCPRQFSQLYSLYGGLGSTLHGKYIHPVLFALLPDKKETPYQYLFTLLKIWCSFWSSAL
jgi:hypothetical protein